MGGVKWRGQVLSADCVRAGYAMGKQSEVAAVAVMEEEERWGGLNRCQVVL